MIKLKMSAPKTEDMKPASHSGLREISAEAGGDLEMWVSRVVRFSSQYNSQGWSANAIIGSPRVFPQYGDIQGAWAQAVCDANQFIEVEFPTAVYVDKVDIYETLNAGAVTRITAVSASGQKVNIWQRHGGPQVITESRIFSPELQSPDFPTRRLELFLDCTQAGTWCELDAIRLTGRQSKYALPTSLKQLSEELFSLINNEEFSDVSFSVDGHVIHGHRAILSARSHYFQAMFSSGMQESKPNKGPIQIQGIGREAFLGLLGYLYTNSVGKDVSVYSLLELIRVGEMFATRGLSQLCFWFVSQELTVDNVLPLYRSAVEELPPLVDCQRLCLDFIAAHIDKISVLPAFTSLPQALMVEIIQHTAAKVSLVSQ